MLASSSSSSSFAAAAAAIVAAGATTTAKRSSSSFSLSSSSSSSSSWSNFHAIGRQQRRLVVLRGGGNGSVFFSSSSPSSTVSLPVTMRCACRHGKFSTRILPRSSSSWSSSSSSSLSSTLQRKRAGFATETSSSSSSSSPSNKPKYGRTRAGTGITDGSGGGASFEDGGDISSMSMIPRGPVSWAGLGLVAVAAAAAVGYYQIERERRLENAMGKIVSSESGWSPDPEYFAKRQFKKTDWGWFPVEDAFGGAGKPAIGGPWSLIDLDGNLVTNKSFEGKWTLLYFGFARCPDICPSEMVKVGKVMDSLKEKHPQLADKIVPIFVSVDPARDSLKALREYAKDFHPSYVFLTGAPEQVQQMAKKYRVYVSKADETEDGDYLVDHSIVIYFHDDTGDLADCFTQSMRPTDVVEKVVERMTFVPSF